ncbi:MAG: META domain-containing protein [Bacteroidota bacterium]
MSCNSTKLSTKSLISSSWLLEKIDGKSLSEEVTLEFSEGRINGKSFCNQYFSNCTYDKENISVESIGATKRACQMMAEENQYFERLRTAKNCEMKEGKLHIQCEQGDLVFTPFQPKSSKSKK